jgi:hypothetical protein
MQMPLMPPAQAAAAEEALKEMQELLLATASASAPNRIAAVRYTLCRTVLMEGPLRPALPGFLIQCVSIFKFHDFITLYDPKVETRLAFIDAALAKSRSVAEAKRSFDVFEDPEF